MWIFLLRLTSLSSECREKLALAKPRTVSHCVPATVHATIDHWASITIQPNFYSILPVILFSWYILRLKLASTHEYCMLTCAIHLLLLLIMMQLGAASRIDGITPAAILILLHFVERHLATQKLTWIILISIILFHPEFYHIMSYYYYYSYLQALVVFFSLQLKD